MMGLVRDTKMSQCNNKISILYNNNIWTAFIFSDEVCISICYKQIHIITFFISQFWNGP